MHTWYILRLDLDLFEDVVPDVRHAALYLDRLLRDIASLHSEKLCVGSFVDELAKRMKYRNPMIRQLCLGWTTLVLSMDHVDLESRSNLVSFHDVCRLFVDSAKAAFHCSWKASSWLASSC